MPGGSASALSKRVAKSSLKTVRTPLPWARSLGRVRNGELGTGPGQPDFPVAAELQCRCCTDTPGVWRSLACASQSELFQNGRVWIEALATGGCGGFRVPFRAGPRRIGSDEGWMKRKALAGSWPAEDGWRMLRRAGAAPARKRAGYDSTQRGSWRGVGRADGAEGCVEVLVCGGVDDRFSGVMRAAGPACLSILAGTVVLP
jgi:hypothetical protein